jgi:hypothetical protein
MRKTTFLKLLTLIVFIGFGKSSNAQNNVGIGTNTPNASSALEVQSTTQGVLVPRMTTAQRLAIPAPANSLLVYDTNFDCYYYYVTATTTWVSLCSAGSGATGPTGPTGTAGVAGTNGVDGATGATGVAGTNGADGATGATGATGVAGTNGATGATGVAGTNGTNGTNGATGATGSIGVTGPTGPGNVFKYSVIGTTDATVAANAAAGAFVLMPQMTLTFTPVNSSVFMHFTAAGTYTAGPRDNHTVWFEVRVNGVSVREWDTFTGIAWNLWDIGVSTPLTVNPGVPNTVEIRWTAQRAGVTNTTINNLITSGTYFNRSLMILDAP